MEVDRTSLWHTTAWQSQIRPIIHWRSDLEFEWMIPHSHYHQPYIPEFRTGRERDAPMSGDHDSASLAPL
jgi:hypothetical protein